MRRIILGLALALVIAACGDASSPTTAPVPTSAATSTSAPTSTSSVIPTTDATTSTTTPDTSGVPTSAARCADPLKPAPASAALEFVPSGVELASITISQAVFACASTVVVVEGGDPDRVALAALAASRERGSLLVTDETGTGLIDFELRRLAPDRVIAIGDVAVTGDFDVERLTGVPLDLFLSISQRYETVDVWQLPPEPSIWHASVLAQALTSGQGVVPVAPDDPDAIAPPDGIPVVAHGAGTSGLAWLVDHRSPEIALVAIGAAHTSGGVAAVVDGDDLRAVGEIGPSLQTAIEVVLMGDVTSAATWQLPVLRSGVELPGGGYLLFPGRRLVALYGNPLSPELGVLGEQDPDAAAIRAIQVSQGYDADGLPVVPAFEIITTVAAADAGADGDYSREMPFDVILPWIEVAEREGFYVLLDLQPGRTDFLTQAKRYEELLLFPHVGLALDPEWRLGPDQFHLQQIGIVQAAEVNQVVDWLADLVRENALPQKLLLLHQFRLAMLQDRETIRKPSELAVVIQMDGQGAVPDKYATWGVLTKGTEDEGWWWGWKNFYDEDVPGPIDPADVLELDPTVVYVSYQ